MHGSRTLLTCVALALLVGCKKEEPIVSYNAPKPPVSTAATQEASAEPAAQVAPPQIAGMSYNAPAAWVAVEPHQFEKARFDVGDNATFATVSPMGPQFEFAPNLARWANQVKVNPPGEKSLQVMTVGGVEAKSVDLKGKTERLIAVVVPRPDSTLIFKLLGPSNGVEAAKSAFDSFLKSISFEGTPTATAEQPTPFVTPAAVNPALPFTYTAPADWKIDPEPRPMRAVTWTAGSGEQKPEIFISGPINAANFDVASNVNRWRKQVGLPPDSANSAEKDVKIGGLPGRIVDLAGPTKRLIVAYAGKDEYWFFKIQGPNAAVAAQKPAFEKFLASVKFNP